MDVARCSGLGMVDQEQPRMYMGMGTQYYSMLDVWSRHPHTSKPEQLMGHALHKHSRYSSDY
jgi:hypothetical protein